MNGHSTAIEPKRPSEVFKTYVNSLLRTSFIPCLTLCVTLVNSDPLKAQTFKTLYGFTGGDDGAAPSGLILSGTSLYGTAAYGGGSSNGTVYSIKTDGTGFKMLHSFTSTSDDGAQPQAPLVLSGTNLYGTANSGGSYGYGTIFKVGIDGTGFAVLHHFAGVSSTDGAYPLAGLTLSGNTLFGTTSDQNLGYGTIFSVNTDGTGFRIVHGLQATEGVHPQAPLLLSSNTLFGTASGVFRVDTDGSGFQVLHPFAFIADGWSLHGGLALAGDRLFGTAAGGGTGQCNCGTVFALNTDGTGFQVLHDFTAMIANYDGASPEADLILSGNKVFSSTFAGGWGWGAIFQVNVDGTGYQTIYNFSDGLTDTPLGGAFPNQKMVLAGNTFYGTTTRGGASGNGTVFSFSVPSVPLQPAISVDHRNLVVQWPNNVIGLKLQSTTNITAPVWTTVSADASINGQNAATNRTPGTIQYFRLIQD
ncbi:MAG TPA: choice-of-anchor tandem repeat GloVer-containing protein [Verrucomicrobiae bacterium]|nr:choice-of-anchor tandem repeat GloVer-containing protein [Verrucomicrobiae bacterium]